MNIEESMNFQQICEQYNWIFITEDNICEFEGWIRCNEDNIISCVP